MEQGESIILTEVRLRRRSEIKDATNLVGHKKKVIPKTTANMVDTELYELVTQEKHGTSFSLNMMKLRSGGEVKRQSHPDLHAIYILSGNCRVLLGDEWVDMEQGGYAYIPPGLPHSFTNVGTDPTEVLILKL